MAAHEPLIVLGIDPGLAATGYGQTFQAVALGVLGTIAAPAQEDFIPGRAVRLDSPEERKESSALRLKLKEPRLRN